MEIIKKKRRKYVWEYNKFLCEMNASKMVLYGKCSHLQNLQEKKIGYNTNEIKMKDKM